MFAKRSTEAPECQGRDVRSASCERAVSNSSPSHSNARNIQSNAHHHTLSRPFSNHLAFPLLYSPSVQGHFQHDPKTTHRLPCFTVPSAQRQCSISSSWSNNKRAAILILRSLTAAFTRYVYRTRKIIHGQASPSGSFFLRQFGNLPSSTCQEFGIAHGTIHTTGNNTRLTLYLVHGNANIRHCRSTVPHRSYFLDRIELPRQTK